MKTIIGIVIIFFGALLMLNKSYPAGVIAIIVGLAAMKDLNFLSNDNFSNDDDYDDYDYEDDYDD